MVAAVRVHKPGGPEVMKYEDDTGSRPTSTKDGKMFMISIHFLIFLSVLFFYFDSGINIY